ncbi:hypothetical protein AY599_08095 [Leptolyngbya valderiana BDU 20041]|nr:hypothetical protein AY599_08095 [Leptolyngbya valderiana BDU 20041]
MRTHDDSIAGGPEIPPLPAVRLLLASGSVRRRDLLTGLGADFHVVPASIDDGQLSPPPTASAISWTMAMAYLKARSAAEELAPGSSGFIVGADTACELDGRIIGKPTNENQARQMLRSMVGQSQCVVTGVAVIDASQPRGPRLVVADVARVTFGMIYEDAIDRYLVTGAWRGKAGGYNLTERIGDGWPITVEGDPDTVVGLPTRRLGGWLGHAQSWGAPE